MASECDHGPDNLLADGPSRIQEPQDGQEAATPRQGGHAQAQHAEQQQERRAVMENFGVHKKGVGYRIVAAVVVPTVVIGMITWIVVT